MAASTISAGGEETLTQTTNGEYHDTIDEPNGEEVNNDGEGSSAAKKKKNKKKKKSAGNSSSSGSTSSDHPISHLDSSLSIPDGIKQHYFDPVKGKGLVATRDYKEGEVVFADEAFVAAPPMSQAKNVEQGKICNRCFQPVESGSGLNIACKGKGCSVVWCNRECENKARSLHHNLLCRGNNPAITPFMDFLSTHPYLSLHSVARLYARLLLCHSPTPPPSPIASSSTGTTTATTSTLSEDLSHISALATISELVRRRRNPGWEMEKRAFEMTFKEALKLLKEGLDPYAEDRFKVRGEQGGIRGKGKWIVNPEFPRNVSESLFSWEGFMKSLGRANLNMESQGSLYCLHSHLNHSCEPNLLAKHPPSKKGIRQATKIELIATEDIPSGQELFITYQDPSQKVQRRNLLLWREHIFGPCECRRCQRELEALDQDERDRILSFKPTDEDAQEVQLRRKQAETLAKEGEQRANGEKDLSGLEDELRETLGF
ncbi:unnamed protein product [Sympodiomycopsis kandeliae]